MVDMANAAYVSSVRIERVKGPFRRAWLPAEQDSVLFGVHGAIAEHYKVPTEVPRTPCDHTRLHCRRSGGLTDWNLRGRAGSASNRCIRREVNRGCDGRSGNRGSSADYPPYSRRVAPEGGS